MSYCCRQGWLALDPLPSVPLPPVAQASQTAACPEPAAEKVAPNPRAAAKAARIAVTPRNAEAPQAAAAESKSPAPARSAGDKPFAAKKPASTLLDATGKRATKKSTTIGLLQSGLLPPLGPRRLRESEPPSTSPRPSPHHLRVLLQVSVILSDEVVPDIADLSFPDMDATIPDVSEGHIQNATNNDADTDTRHWITRTEGALSRGTFGQFLRRDRFQDTARYLHFNDSELQQTSGDRAFKIRPHLNSATMPKTRKPPGTNSDTEGAETTPALQLQQAVALQDQDQPHFPLVDPDRPAVRQRFAAVDDIVLLKTVNLYRHWTAPAGTSNGIMNAFNQIAAHWRLDPAFGPKKQGSALRAQFNTLMRQFKADQCQSMRKSGTVEEYEEREVLLQKMAKYEYKIKRLEFEREQQHQKLKHEQDEAAKHREHELALEERRMKADEEREKRMHEFLLKMLSQKKD
ncbi:unnamed protein product [Phytophthora fragariaefolia]|uniref:Unnamed protein product n=1 Tax=Phytophthora fragariaefolia TaxID=1490495 RepID=A0A9W6TJI9_9STRA|nr:unnamed protein product [Phytophthora fragariaefolia]